MQRASAHQKEIDEPENNNRQAGPDYPEGRGNTEPDDEQPDRSVCKQHGLPVGGEGRRAGMARHGPDVERFEVDGSGGVVVDLTNLANTAQVAESSGDEPVP